MSDTSNGMAAVEDGEIKWRSFGEGPPVLMVQGVGIAGSGWNPQVEGLADRFHCVSYDNRGLGESTAPYEGLSIERMAEDALAVMDALEWESAHVTGHSMGGLIAQAVALAAPERVRSLALLCTFARGTQATRFEWGIAWLGMRMYVGTRQMRRRAAISFVLPDAYIASRDFDELHDELAAVFGRDMSTQPKVVMPQMNAMKVYDPSERIAEIAHLPTFVMTAEGDRVARAAFSHELAKSFGVDAVILEGSGHACTVQHADRVNEMLADHWTACAE